MTETVLSHAPLTGPDLARACGVTTLPVSALLTFPTGSGKPTWRWRPQRGP